MNHALKHRTMYALAGALLGLGAPLGSLAWRLIFSEPGILLERVSREWNQASYFYIYMTAGTMIAFGLFGFILGNKGDALEQEKRRARTLAITDGLTGLYNHRYLQDHLAAEMERARRYKTPLTCLMLDIDDFKRVNDTQGHPFGDHVLKIVAHVIREQVRRVDTAGRYGGEEFLILMPHTTANEIMPLAERIRMEVQEYPFNAGGQNIHVTLSIGVATYDPHAESFRDKAGLLQAADDALYSAKNHGKNRTHVWSKP
jgi:diguanylate cyclase (GGDEF)-like protein